MYFEVAQYILTTLLLTVASCRLLGFPATVCYFIVYFDLMKQSS